MDTMTTDSMTPSAPPPTDETPPLTGTALVDATWQELGFKLKPVGNRIFVRTDMAPKKIGAIYMPPEMWGMYGRRLGSQVFVTATVLSNGSRVKQPLEAGTRVVFSRLPFGWTYKLDDGTFVGWVDADEVVAVTEGGEVLPFFQKS